MATVLLVEDDHVVRGAMLRSLTDRGHAVHAVGTALDALRRVAAETPDLVVLDLGLPDLDGSDALRMLRGITDVPIIVERAIYLFRSSVDKDKLLIGSIDLRNTSLFSLHQNTVGSACGP